MQKSVASQTEVVEGKMARFSNPELEKIIGKHFPVLKEGFVALVDYMGGDPSIVQAARVSYGQGTKSVNDDTGLIRYLMRHRHTTPFEMVQLKFVARMPIYVARQWIRHRTASVNEYSSRYSVLQDRFDIPELERIQPQSASNKQGREGKLDDNVAAGFQQSVKDISSAAYAAYGKALEGGVARETARILLPVNTYTEWYWNINLHNLFHFLSLRLDSHAQHEIRLYGKAIADITKVAVPIAYEAFMDYNKGGITFSKKEQTAIAAIMRGEAPETACAIAGLKLRRDDGTPMKSGEGVEFMEKYNKIVGDKR